MLFRFNNSRIKGRLGLLPILTCVNLTAEQIATLINPLFITDLMGHTIGGQAVIEGVMLRSQNYYVTSVRNPKGKIVTQTKKIKKKPKFLSFPFLRGVVNLIEMLVIGIKTLSWSANQAGEEEEQLTNFQMTLTLITAFAFAIGLFVALPYFLSILTGVSEETQPILFNLIDGIIKVIILISYMFLISLMKDIKRVFEYHGAEHKTVYCYEEGKKITLKNVKKYSTKHPRCGTSFLIIVVLISIVVFALLPSFLSLVAPSYSTFNFIVRKLILFSLRIFVLPIIAAFSYEFLKLSHKFHSNPIMKLIALPGILLQFITTKEPSDDQIKTAISSMDILLKKEKITL